MIHDSGAGPILQDGFYSRKQQLNHTDEHSNIFFSSSLTIPGSGKMISNAYFKIYILSDFADESDKMKTMITMRNKKEELIFVL